VLCEMNRFMMHEFSRRTAAGLGDYKTFKVLLPPFQSFLDINVRKEVEKDRLVILRAAEAQAAERQLGPQDTERLLRKARDIDQAFVRDVSLLPISISIQYGDIEHVRRRRIEQLLEAVYRLLVVWNNVAGFRAAICALYDRREFQSFLHENLRLYSVEIRMLGNSVRVPRVLAFARDTLTQTVYSVTEKVAAELAGELAAKVFRRIA